MRKVISALLAALMLTSCASYTVDRGLESIQVPVYGELPSTKLNDIEAEKALDAERQRQEQKLLDAAAAMEEAIVAKEGRNDYPHDLSQLEYPHVYRPADSQSVLDEAFTRVDVLLIPLGDTPLGADRTATVAASVRDLGFEFIALTGSLENQTAFAVALGMDAVTLTGGTICFTPSLKSATSSVASFSLCPGKDLDLMVIDLFDDADFSLDLDIAGWIDHASIKSDAGIKAIDAVVGQSADGQKILALSSSEPSSLDWSIFTPYEYRTRHSWAISDHLATLGYSDSYRATHFSEETDSGVTLAAGGIHERMDALYSQGLMEVSSSTLALSGLSDQEIQRYATAATYIVP